MLLSLENQEQNRYISKNGTETQVIICIPDLKTSKRDLPSDKNKADKSFCES